MGKMVTFQASAAVIPGTCPFCGDWLKGYETWVSLDELKNRQKNKFCRERNRKSLHVQAAA
jgi:hypothetical protein